MEPQTLDLRDIHLPEPISWWPVAPGWWLLLASLIVILVFVFLTKKHYSSKQLNREIKTELEQIKRQFKKSNNKLELAKSLSVLLRRASISLYSEKEVAGLTGDQWLAFLDKTQQEKSSSSTHKFTTETGKALITAPYLPESNDFDFDTNALIKLCEHWLNSQKASTT